MMKFTAEDFARLSEDKKTEILSAFPRLMERNDRMEQEAMRLEQDVRALGNDFASLGEDPVSEERKAQVRETLRILQRRSEGIKQERDSITNELAALGFGGIFSRPRKHHDQPLNPSLWSTLPHELQQHVFAHLPLRHIIRLQVLSKTWHQYVTGAAGAIPEFSKKWAEINPKLFGMLCEGHDYDEAGIMAVRIYDTDSRKWRRFKHYSIFNEFIETMHAGDGGLVCIVPLGSDKQQRPMSIVVLNPLTRQGKELPELPPALSSVQPQMVQLVMDWEAKSYKVLVVGTRDVRLGGEGVRVYSSVTGEWSSPEASPDLIFGYRYSFTDYGDLQFLSVRGPIPCAYDCASGTLLALEDEQSPWRALPGVTSYALVKERLFVLQKETYQYVHDGVVEEGQRYCISEYAAQAQRRQLVWNQAQICRVVWVLLKVHACNGFDELASENHDMQLHACNGVLLVTTEGSDLAWLCDLSSSKWETISSIPQSSHDEGEFSMFELQWGAIP